MLFGILKKDVSAKSATRENGVFIAAREIENDGTIEGPAVNVITEKYSGKGKISGYSPEKLGNGGVKKWYEKPAGILVLGTVAGIVASLIFAYLNNWFGLGN